MVEICLQFFECVLCHARVLPFCHLPVELGRVPPGCMEAPALLYNRFSTNH